MLFHLFQRLRTEVGAFNVVTFDSWVYMEGVISYEKG